MKVPASPPSYEALLRSTVETDASRLLEITTQGIGPTDRKGQYLHWDKLRHLAPPEGLSNEEYWLATKMARASGYKPLPLHDKQGHPFRYMIPDAIWEQILWIEKHASGTLMMEETSPGQQTGKHYLVSSLVEEAITSSQLEGASTTRRVAKEMLETGRRPDDVSERMIYNNYRAMAFAKEYGDEQLTPSLILELHRTLTEGTLPEEDQGREGTLRRKGEDICVFAHDNTLLHVPPPVDELQGRLKAVCDFANRDEESNCFMPALVKAIILHFMIGYDHPFVDGNGRTARALFYWHMAREHYWLMEYISISRVIKAAPAKYMQAYLYSETDDNDLTYFIAHQVGVVKQAIEDLHHYIRRKQQELAQIETLLSRSRRQVMLNHRQIRLLERAVRNPGEEYTIKAHQAYHGVAYQTARTDLLNLADDLKLLRRRKHGKQDVFSVPSDIADRLRRL